MSDYPKKLFPITPVWGVTPGAHVAHIIVPDKNKTHTPITVFSKPRNRHLRERTPEEISKVSHDEVFANKGDDTTAKVFLGLARLSELYYDKENNPDEYKDLLLTLKAYLTASGRRSRQQALKDYKAKAKSLLQRMKKENEDAEKGDTAINPATQRMNRRLISEIESINTQISTLTGGKLEVGDYTYNKNDIQDPDNTAIGAFGVWVSTDDELFSHTPSPNDVKQGYGVKDCFMLSALIKIAADSPEEIQKRMKDNGDGTVTVLFYNEQGNSGQKVPVYVTVNKTVNRLAGVGDVYASSSLWVQMMEKAYIKYLSQYKHEYLRFKRVKPNSYSAIDTDLTSNFMNAFDKEKNYENRQSAFGFNHYLSRNDYEIVNGQPKYTDNREYNDLENGIFDFFKQAVNKDGETITVGNSGMVKANKGFALDHGIRTGHAYTLLGVFEKDGKKYVQLRDPYATFRSKLDQNGRITDDSSRLFGTLNAGLDNMATFNIELFDFMCCFDSFPGISQNAGIAFNAMLRKVDARQRNASVEEQVNADAQQPDVLQANANAQPDVPAANEAQPQNEIDYAGLNIENEAVQNKEEAPSGGIYEMLKDPDDYARIKSIVEYLKTDLDSTAMFFSFKNTDKFVKMRDKLNSVNKQFAAVGKKEEPDEKDLLRLGDELTELSGLAAVYAEAKYKSIEKNKANGSEPSPRAIHRLAAAVSLMGITNGTLQVAQSEHGFAESLDLAVNDIDTQLAVLEEKASSDLIERRKQTLNRAKHSIDSYLQNHEEIRNQVRTVREQNSNRPVPKPALDESKLERGGADEFGDDFFDFLKHEPQQEQKYNFEEIPENNTTENKVSKRKNDLRKGINFGLEDDQEIPGKKESDDLSFNNPY